MPTNSHKDLFDWLEYHLEGLEWNNNSQYWNMYWSNGESSMYLTVGDSLVDCINKAIAGDDTEVNVATFINDPIRGMLDN